LRRGEPADTEDAIAEYYGAIFSDYLGATGDGALSVAVDRFADPVEHAFLSRHRGPDGEPDVEWLLWNAWYVLIETAVASDETIRTKLVDLVLGLQRRGALASAPEGHECRVWDMRVWDELPLFGPQMREALNRDFDDSYLELNAFAAQVTAAGHGVTGAVDFTLWAMWAFRDCLEATPEQLREAGIGGELEDRLLVVLVWLRHCGPFLAALAAEHPGEDGAMFSLPRWMRWRDRLGAIADGNEPAAAVARNVLLHVPSLL
jgi:hypothetical protein